MDRPVTPPPFLVRAGGRLFRITAHEPFTSCDDDWVPVDALDSQTGFSSQAIIIASAAASRESIIAEDQVRDAIRSAYLNATTTWNRDAAGRATGIANHGVHLPDGFPIT